MGKFDKSTGKVVQQWKKVCCQEAVDACNDLGLGTTRCAGTVRKLNHVFSQHRGKFPHPNHHILKGIKPTPLFFEWYPLAAIDCKIYVLSKLDHFNGEMLWVELIKNIIPCLVNEANKDGTDPESREYKLLREYTEKLLPILL